MRGPSYWNDRSKAGALTGIPAARHSVRRWRIVGRGTKKEAGRGRAAAWNSVAGINKGVEAVFKKIVVAVGLLICCLLVGAVGLAAPKVGDAAPQIMVNNGNGQMVGLLQFDRVTIINFWATWCPPCWAEMPELNSFAEKHRDDVYFYSISDEPEGTVNGFMQKNGYSLPVVLDTNSQINRQYGITAIPTTFIIDKSGMIRYKILGGTTTSKLEDMIGQL